MANKVKVTLVLEVETELNVSQVRERLSTLWPHGSSDSPVLASVRALCDGVSPVRVLENRASYNTEWGRKLV